ncbi:hypothetical protein [Halomonas sp. MES3-P3E]|uniref:hypothetical protein n=1 Tax=Halomonas sp. MES3-P3E TaxID=2058321 RepID=UPI0012FEA2B4|nr:hypothetical protein [Halomonas sp. MES3-P3E]
MFDFLTFFILIFDKVFGQGRAGQGRGVMRGQAPCVNHLCERLKRQHTAEANAKHGNDNNNDNDDSGSRWHVLFL